MSTPLLFIIAVAVDYALVCILMWVPIFCTRRCRWKFVGGCVGIAMMFIGVVLAAVALLHVRYFDDDRD